MFHVKHPSGPIMFRGIWGVVRVVLAGMRVIVGRVAVRPVILECVVRGRVVRGRVVRGRVVRGRVVRGREVRGRDRGVAPRPVVVRFGAVRCVDEEAAPGQRAVVVGGEAACDAGQGGGGPHCVRRVAGKGVERGGDEHVARRPPSGSRWMCRMAA